MVEFVHQYPGLLETEDGTLYVTRAYTAQRPQLGAWEAWFVFFPTNGGRPIATDRETTQGKRDDVDYWASGVTSTYLEGALARALESSTKGALERRKHDAAAPRDLAEAEAAAYAAAAEEVRAYARLAEERRRAVQSERKDVRDRPVA